MVDLLGHTHDLVGGKTVGLQADLIPYTVKGPKFYSSLTNFDTYLATNTSATSIGNNQYICDLSTNSIWTNTNSWSRTWFRGVDGLSAGKCNSSGAALFINEWIVSVVRWVAYEYRNATSNIFLKILTKPASNMYIDLYLYKTTLNSYNMPLYAYGFATMLGNFSYSFYINDYVFTFLQISLANHNHDSVYLKLTGGTCTGDIIATNFYVSSDIRYKNVTNILDYTSELLSTIPLIKYTWNDNRDCKLHVGTSAQAVELIIPEITYTEEGKDFKTVDYATLGVVSGLTANKEIIELKLTIEKQQLQIDSLLEQIALLIDTIKELK